MFAELWTFFCSVNIEGQSSIKIFRFPWYSGSFDQNYRVSQAHGVGAGCVEVGVPLTLARYVSSVLLTHVTWCSISVFALEVRYMAWPLKGQQRVLILSVISGSRERKPCCYHSESFLSHFLNVFWLYIHSSFPHLPTFGPRYRIRY